MLVSKIKNHLINHGVNAVVSNIARSAQRDAFLRRHVDHKMYLVADTPASWKTFAASLPGPCFVGVGSPMVSVNDDRITGPIYQLLVAH